ncbi:LytTR family DNA-binding domain-containing protein [Brevundimonas sp.]|uniref:LytTR family DNA-binding domain-containing protein n=1 Tax=Brevundimonas sp. TaxID=1871086 RepID=UPI001DBD20B3|nr:LytTR family DNA-binding domain-containing protein [Brevundimonas sp.]MBA3999003.1 hypothetical protein [Brevundimonas sp.]
MSARLKRLITGDPAKGVGIAVAAGVFLALTNAFGSTTDLWLRLAYWVVLMIAAGLWAEVCMRAVRRVPGMEASVPARFVVSVLVIGLPLTLVVWGVTGWIFYGQAYGFDMLPGLVWRVLLITAGMTAIGMALEPKTVTTKAGDEPPRFLDRLPPRLRGAVIHAVQAEDHYLRIHTDRGSDLILMRLSDAVAELQGLEGAQTHRSWWVAKDAVQDVKRGDGRATLTLDGGLTVPVSRRHARALRAAGWY